MQLIYSPSLVKFLEREDIPYHVEETKKKNKIIIVDIAMTDQEVFNLGKAYENYLTT